MQDLVIERQYQLYFEFMDKDAIAYNAVGVSSGKIFIINPQGQISQYNTTLMGSNNKIISF